MKIIPAIDIKDGQCVRLLQGDYEKITRYSKDPVEMAKKWEKLGAKIIHIVDLDGAKTGKLVNLEIIKDIVENIKVPVEVGGGIRTSEAVKKYLGVGVERVIIGTAAIKNPQWVKEMIDIYGDKICVSIDAKNEFIASEGWIEVSEIKAVDFILKLEKWGIATIVYTDISKDGMLKGPNFEMYEKISKETKIKIIASGGVTTINDIKKLKEINLYGAIIGKALYDGLIDLREAIKC